MKRLILVSGWASSVERLTPLTTELSQHFDVSPFAIPDLKDLVPDNRKPITDNPSLPSPSVFAQGLLQHLNGEDAPVVLCGWSMGGLICQEAAARAPDKISTLVLMSSTSRFFEADDYTCGKSPADGRNLGMGLKTQPEAALGEFFKIVDLPFVEPDAIAARVTDALSLGMDYLFEGLDYLAHTDLRKQLDQLVVDALLLHGEEDAIIDRAASEYMCSHIPDATLVSYGGLGHDVPLRHAEQVTADIVAHVK